MPSEREIAASAWSLAFGDVGGDARDDVVVGHLEPHARVSTLLNRSVTP